MNQESINNSRQLLNSQSSGVLSTISKKYDGFPVGSVVPYCLDENGQLVILISTIAEHTKNIIANQKCSITITPQADDVQANGRLCVIGNMELLPEDEVEVKERYYRHFPKSRKYHEAHDFHFYRLLPVTVRYIGGFGKIHWFTPEEVNTKNPFHDQGEQRIVSHMNDDHPKDLITYCEFYKGMIISEADQVKMVGIDANGFDVFVNDKKVRFNFDAPIADAMQAREALVEMSKGAL